MTFVLYWLKGEYTTGTWEEKSREINFADFKFSVTHHFLKQECAESEGKDDGEEGTSAAGTVAKISPKNILQCCCWMPGKKAKEGAQQEVGGGVSKDHEQKREGEQNRNRIESEK